jgi:RNA polymerase sigma factor (sigma-70 family)
MSNNKINNRFILLVEDVIQWKDISLSEYNFIKLYVNNIIKQKWYAGIVCTDDITNEMLLRLKDRAATYRFTDNIWWRKRYIYYYILYCIDDTIALTQYWLDIPQRILKDNSIDNHSLCISLDYIEELPDKENYTDIININMENDFLLNLLISDISEKEKDILVKHYFKWLTQQEIATEYWVSQQRIWTIISNVKARFKYNCNSKGDGYL